MRKILFVPSGIGLGHVTRTEAVIEQLRRKVEYRVASYGSAYAYLDRKGFSPIQLRGFDYHGEYSFELMKTLVKESDLFFKLAGDYLKISKVQKEFDFDTVVSDSDPIGVLSANLLKKRNILIENLDGVIRETKYIPKRFQESLGYQIAFIEQVDRYVAQYLDEIIITSFDKEPFKMRKKHNVGLVRNNEIDPLALREASKQEFVCVPIPGSTLTYDIIKDLLQLFKKFSNQNFFLINFPTQSIKKIKNVYLFPFMSNAELQAYMQASKAVISFAGFSTLTEIAYHKKPSLILPLPNHIEQIANATFFRRNRLAEVVFPRKGYELEVVEKLFKRMLQDAHTYSSNIEAMNFKFDGAQRAARVILNED